MKSFIPKQPKHVRERIDIKLEARLLERLHEYCEYLDSDRDYIFAQALEMVFRKDKGFEAWLAQREQTCPAESATTSARRQPV